MIYKIISALVIILLTVSAVSAQDDLEPAEPGLYGIPPRWIIDMPTAGTLPRGSFDMSVRVYSGGALGIGVGDRVAIMQYAYCSVISPEGCAAILWGTSSKASLAAEVLKLTGKSLRQTGYVDTIIPEPAGGAHGNKCSAACALRAYLTATLLELERYDISALLEKRYQMLRRIGSSAVSQGRDMAGLDGIARQIESS